jgi:hypothetical protein
MAAQATLHCLTGCAIGEVLGMILGTALSASNLFTTALSIVLAFMSGYALTIRGLKRHGLEASKAARLALKADTISIATMEVADNLTMLLIPGAMGVGLGKVIFWLALAISLVVAFLAAWPVNRWLLGRGQGHAVVHEYH